MTCSDDSSQSDAFWGPLYQAWLLLLWPSSMFALIIGVVYYEDIVRQPRWLILDLPPIVALIVVTIAIAYKEIQFRQTKRR